MWGSILAMWGTAAIVATSSRGLGINKVRSRALTLAPEYADCSHLNLDVMAACTSGKCMVREFT